MNNAFSGRLLKVVGWTAVTVVAPIVISRLSAFFVLGLFSAKILIGDDLGVMMRVTAIVIDLLAQSIYFSFLAWFTQRWLLLVIMCLYQIFMVTMFLRYGSAMLYLSVVGSFKYLGIF